MTTRTQDDDRSADGLPRAGVIGLLLELRQADVRVWTSEGQLRWQAATGEVDAALRNRLTQETDAIVAFLEDMDSVESSTHYVTMRDGVRIAVDVFRPKRDGEVVTTPLPAIWCHDRYHRSDIVDGIPRTKLDTRPWLREVLKQGYVIAAADSRGSGASTGSRGQEFSPEETRDAYEITEWLAAQEWCSGNIGMFGESYLGITQFLAAGTAPPSLKAIFPQVALFDLYSFLYPGGILRHDFIHNWGTRVRALDTQLEAAPVQDDDDAVREAVAGHQVNADVFARALTLPFRDSRSPEDDGLPFERQSPASAVAAVRESPVAIYQLAGWHDIWVRDAFQWHANLGGPRKLIVGDWSHDGREGADLATEHLRWFDHWLKGIDTGVMDEPSIRYYRRSAAPGEQWRGTEQWPPAEVRTERLYFAAGDDEPLASVNDGALTTAEPSRLGGMDEFVVDYTASSGTATRWTNGYGGPFGYPPMTANDANALTYTTPPLTQALEVTGHPVIRLWVTSTHPDGDFFVYLEDVAPDGESHYVTEGVVRASHRALGTAPYDNLGLPYFPSAEADCHDLPEEPTALTVDLHPISHVFGPGHRLRIAVTGCDRDNARTPVHYPPPVVQIHRRGPQASYVDLPVFPTSQS
ncbi:CocE/NonD family hydrolase [Streptomyces sp. NBC_01244]|uniref:CocE/NonD family hydrolase n=1 Tax=Streptomyces sp. NBC_01244 TaxID=2903797 RepID=UPI002E0E14CA|nr:CocE/NonD family hydrolase [Streptomyces sp. NBC_01244]